MLERSVYLQLLLDFCIYAVVERLSIFLLSSPTLQHPSNRNQIYGTLFFSLRWLPNRIPFPKVQVLKWVLLDIAYHAKSVSDWLRGPMHKFQQLQVKFNFLEILFLNQNVQWLPRGAEADVPVCSTVQMWSGLNRASISTVATLLSWPGVPELYVVAKVEEHSSKYHGLYLKRKMV